MLRLESNFEGVVRLVLGHRDQLDLGVREVGQGRSVDVAKELGDLTDSIGAVVEEEHDIIVLVGLGSIGVKGSWTETVRTLNAAFLATDDDRLEELVVLPLLISLLDCLDGVGALLTLA